MTTLRFHGSPRGKMPDGDPGTHPLRDQSPRRLIFPAQALRTARHAAASTATASPDALHQRIEHTLDRMQRTLDSLRQQADSFPFPAPRDDDPAPPPTSPRPPRNRAA
ncbi:MAG: hypothetical protein C0513_04955 [Isosphaera sp.]|nr:hypothetical protein [Isosphaera sp.]